MDRPRTDGQPEKDSVASGTFAAMSGLGISQVSQQLLTRTQLP